MPIWATKLSDIFQTFENHRNALSRYYYGYWIISQRNFILASNIICRKEVVSWFWFLWICSTMEFFLQAFIQKMQLAKTFIIKKFVGIYGTYFCELFKSKKKIPPSWRYARNSNSRKFGFNSQRMQARFSLPQLPKGKKSYHFFQQMFGDVRFICMGGTPQVWWTHDYDESNVVQTSNRYLLIIIKAMLCKRLKTSLSPEDENVCRVHAWPAGIPLANRQLLTF